MTTLKIKDCDRVVTPWNETFRFVLLSKLGNPNLFSQSFRNLGFAIH